jgi:glycosyltransferase involved in cell wall biosynthesis
MRGKKVMDIGSGFRVDSVTFAHHGTRLSFVDLVETNLRVLERRGRNGRIRKSSRVCSNRPSLTLCFNRNFTIAISIGSTACIEERDLSTAAEPSSKTTVMPTQPTKEWWPRIALVTPVRNSGRYLEQTILSVLAQNYPNLDYFIVDGGSTDGSVDIIRKYEDRISGWISEPDNGMYDAINKGFARTTGEVMGWISATDMLHIGGLRVVGSVFRQLPDVEWITGRPAVFSDEGMGHLIYPNSRWAQYRFLAGQNRYIMQEATYWRRSLWDKAGGYVDASKRYVSDFELWVRFFRHAKLYPVDALIAGYRAHPDALGVSELAECHRIQDEAVAAELERVPHGKALKAFRAVGARMRKIRGFRYVWWRLAERPLYAWWAPDLPPLIRYHSDRGGWTFEKI